MKIIIATLCALALTACATVSAVTSPMRHMKACHYNFFAPKAEAKYYDLIRQGYSHNDARDSTIRWTGILQLNVSYEFLEECVCRPENCDNYFNANPDNHTRKIWRE
jgi:hypothetical protein